MDISESKPKPGIREVNILSFIEFCWELGI